ncbi:hypothetical protein [Actinoplanes sp. N902-109]|uniref:hypothetical protein n=1 Tax=Actinoplanes sp. (strain N902-109) TaxID=649831 RepID=UPI0005A08558|nr:hypothetical protein [Actinoplanes sp. N902-109]
MGTSVRSLWSAGVATGSAGAPVGSVRSAAAPEFDSTVWALAFRGDVIYAGGSFTQVSVRGRTYARKRLAAFSARTGTILPWHPTANGTVRSLAVARTGRPAVYAAGDFDEVDGMRRDSIARLDAVTGRLAPFSHSVSGEVTTLAIGNGRVYAAGSFKAVDGTARPNLVAFRHSSGAVDRSFRTTVDSRVRGLAVTRTRLYLGGDFHKVNGSAARRLAAVSTSSGRLVTGFRPAAPATVLDLAVSPSGLSVASGGPGGRAAGYTAAGKVRWTHLFDGDVHNLAVSGRTTYVGGHFDRACRTTSTIEQLGCPAGYASRVKLAALDDHGRLTSWNPHANGTVGVQVLTAAGGRVAAGGAFTSMGGHERERFALFS